MWTVILISVALVGLIMLAMAIGVIAGRPCLRGSCGGPEVAGPDGVPLSCATCPNRLKNRLESSRAQG